MTPSLTRTAACALSITLALGAAAVPCAAADTPGTNGSSTALTRLSPASRAVLARTSGPAASAQDQPGATGSSQSFFKTKKGAVTLALMGAGVGFTIWSINHDRKPVKSPVR